MPDLMYRMVLKTIYIISDVVEMTLCVMEMFVTGKISGKKNKKKNSVDHVCL